LKSILLLFLFLLGWQSCQIDRTIHPISDKDHFRIRGFQAMKSEHKLDLATHHEAGQRLIICGKLIHQENKTPLRYQPIHFLQTDLNGGDSNNLSGNLHTNDLGMFFLETILPSDMDHPADNPHIHTTVIGASPDTYDLHFKQFTTFMVKRSVESSDQHFLVDLKMGKDSALVGFITMEIKGVGTKN
jgi:hypothetical protein